MDNLTKAFKGCQDQDYRRKVINKFSPAECHARNLLTIVRTLEANHQGLSFTYDVGECGEGEVLVVYNQFVRQYPCLHDAIVGTRAILDYVNNCW